ECPGYLVAPKAAKAVLEVITKILDIEMNFEKLDERVKKTEEFLENIKLLETTEEKSIKEDYIG
ncbi:proteasome assembly chaperone family protein, partial [Thermococci archaeon]